MEFSTGRVEGALRIKEYPSDHAGQERKPPHQRPRQESSPDDEDELLPSDKDEVHQLDDLV